MITSSSNQQLKYITSLMKKAKIRREEGLFVVEGPKMYGEIPDGWLKKTYVSEWFLRESAARQLLVRQEYEVVSDGVFRGLSDTQTPQGILALVSMPYYGLDDLLRGDKTHLLILDGIQDPGNLGTMFRTGEGAGITGIVMSRDTVDLFNPKTIRSTMGSIYRVPYFVAEDLCGIIRTIKGLGTKVYAAHLEGSVPYDTPSYRGAAAFLIGNEGSGISAETMTCADEYIRIPMEGSVESLNAAVSAAILMYEAARQRRNGESYENLV